MGGSDRPAAGVDAGVYIDVFANFLCCFAGDGRVFAQLTTVAPYLTESLAAAAVADGFRPVMCHVVEPDSVVACNDPASKVSETT